MEFAELLNIRTVLCKEDKAPCQANHLQLHHNIHIPEIQELLQIMKEKSEELSKGKGKKKELLQKLEHDKKRN